jgi:hypothetical protein
MLSRARPPAIDVPPKELLHCRRLPARLTVAQVALLLGFLEQEIPVLVKAKLLKYLGRPAPNAHKYFCAAEIEALSKDRAFLDQASRAVATFVQKKNRYSQKPHELTA